ncbi:hypothetical protein B6A10_08060 [Flavobacterium sp. L1I52]|uniref:DUF4294 domain-containing protein n=1 Tax=Flavobacterium pokkalii TaxID=1940408 RepID=A0ABR7UQE6_9FLAO|nr:DUF4294 domain-containing protein [Flavobacterium pokkalii]KQB41712.1 DUF4294 domain containing protein [Flavobacterium daejeonense]MBD0725130.1 hypothetical protein [Flavobacterium pokkalii]
MKPVYLIAFFLIISFSGFSQIVPNNPNSMGYVLTEKDSILNDTIKLPEIIISKNKLDEEGRKQYLILQNRVYRTYPYAKLAADRLTNLNRGMARLTSEREKKKYFKIVEDYLTNEFEARLKKLSRSQGRILVRLIDRQTGTTTYELIKTLKSGWKAFWSNTAASMFDINLKAQYLPFENNEDYLIENILQEAFDTGRLQNQPAAKPVNLEKLNEYWEQKLP